MLCTELMGLHTGKIHLFDFLGKRQIMLEKD